MTPKETEAVASAAMSGWGRLLGVGAGVVIIVGGLLVLGGSRSGWVLGAAAAVVLIGWLAARTRFS